MNIRERMKANFSFLSELERSTVPGLFGCFIQIKIGKMIAKKTRESEVSFSSDFFVAIVAITA